MELKPPPRAPSAASDATGTTQVPGDQVAKSIQLAVCCITRERPNMLSDLLTSLGELDIPEGVSPSFVVVENDSVPRCESLVKVTAEHLGANRTFYAHEAELGIPIARNKAIEVALKHGADLIAFIDDDEIADKRWLTELLATYRETQAGLIGGPVQARLDEDPPSNFMARLVRSGLVARYRRIARKCEQRSQSGRIDRITIVTNNWLADAKLFTEHGLSFDEGLRFTGGSDTKFYRDVRRTGILTTAWAEKAVVLEAMPEDRLTYRYQFRRAMEQSRTSIRAKIRRKGRWMVALSAPFSLAARVVTTSLLLVTAPIRPADNLLRFVRSYGWMAGRITGIAGSSSALYRTTTGA